MFYQTAINKIRNIADILPRNHLQLSKNIKQHYQNFAQWLEHPTGIAKVVGSIFAED